MKHLLIGLSLVAAVTGFCLWSASYVRGAVEETARLQVTVQAGDQDEFLPGCAALLETLDHVRDMELPVFANLF